MSIEERIIKVAEEPLGLWAVQRNKRELRAIALEVHKLEDRIKQLEEAGDDCASLLDAIRPNTAAYERWCRAKEAKL